MRIRCVLQCLLLREGLPNNVSAKNVLERNRVRGSGNVCLRDFGDLCDIVDNGVELARQSRHFFIGQGNTGEHAQMAHKIRGNLRHRSSLEVTRMGTGYCALRCGMLFCTRPTSARHCRA